MKVIGNRVLVVVDESEKLHGGIVLPGDTQQEGSVFAVGETRNPDGSISSLFVKEGDKVLFTEGDYPTVRFGDQKLIVLKEEDCIAVLEEEE